MPDQNQFESQSARLFRIQQAITVDNSVYVDAGYYASIVNDAKDGFKLIPHASEDAQSVDSTVELVTNELRSCSALALCCEDEKFLCHVSAASSEEISGWVRSCFSKPLQCSDLNIKVWYGENPMLSLANVLGALKALGILAKVIDFDLVKTTTPLLMATALNESLSYRNVDKAGILADFAASDYGQLLMRISTGEKSCEMLTAEEWVNLLSEFEKADKTLFAKVTYHRIQKVKAEDIVSTQELNEKQSDLRASKTVSFT